MLIIFKLIQLYFNKQLPHKIRAARAKGSFAQYFAQKLELPSAVCKTSMSITPTLKQEQKQQKNSGQPADLPFF